MVGFTRAIGSVPTAGGSGGSGPVTVEGWAARRDALTASLQAKEPSVRIFEEYSRTPRSTRNAWAVGATFARRRFSARSRVLYTLFVARTYNQTRTDDCIDIGFQVRTAPPGGAEGGWAWLGQTGRSFGDMTEGFTTEGHEWSFVYDPGIDNGAFRLRPRLMFRNKRSSDLVYINANQTVLGTRPSGNPFHTHLRTEEIFTAP